VHLMMLCRLFACANRLRRSKSPRVNPAMIDSRSPSLAVFRFPMVIILDGFEEQGRKGPNCAITGSPTCALTRTYHKLGEVYAQSWACECGEAALRDVWPLHDRFVATASK
jgi:hypothetical protein